MIKVVIVCLLLVRCDPGAITEIPVNNPRLVIQAEPENGRPWNVSVTRTLPLLDPKSAYFYYPRGVPGARVMLFKDAQFIEELTATGPDSLMQTFVGAGSPPEPGHTYSIKVDAPGFESVHATYVHPLPVAIDEVKFEITAQYDNGANSNAAYTQLVFDLDVTITDPAPDNYYEFAFFRASSPDLSTAEVVVREVMYTLDVNYRTSNGFLGSFINDNKFPGQTTTLKFQSYTNSMLITADTLSTPFFFVQLRNLSKPLSDWKTYLSSPGPSTYDPYAQPSLVKTNVESGMGVFAGYSASVKSFYYQPF